MWEGESKSLRYSGDLRKKNMKNLTEMVEEDL